MVISSKRFVFVLILLLLCLGLYSQQSQRIVTGTITDSETGEPVPSAAIFIANTTVGTTTDEKGNYRLIVPGTGSYEVVVSHVGYEPIMYKLDFPLSLEKYDATLMTYKFEDIVVIAKKQYRKEDVKLFWDRLLGVQPSKNLEIVNPNDINFFYNVIEKTVKVTCNVPIQIINHESGYKIYYTLRYFQHNYKYHTTNWSGNALFEELKPINTIQQDKWEKNRNAIFHLSLNHFLRALYHDKLHEGGFLLNYEQKPKISSPLNVNELIYVDSIPDSKIFQVGGRNRLLLTCFGKQITANDISKQARIVNYPLSFFRRGGAINYLSSRSREGTIRIFPDGTYVGSLEVIPYLNSPAISGLINMLPLEYNLQ